MKKIGLLLCVLLVGCQNTGVTRTLPQKITDVTTERQLLSVLDGVAGLTHDNHRVAMNTYRGELLLTGEVPTYATKLAIGERAATLPNVTKVYNYLTVSENKSQSHTVHEHYLRAKILAKLVASRAIKRSQYELVVRGDTLYMMGAVTYPQLALIQQTVIDTDGVLAMVSLLNIMVVENDSDIAPQNYVPQSYSPQNYQPVSPQGYLSQNYQPTSSQVPTITPMPTSPSVTATGTGLQNHPYTFSNEREHYEP